MSTSRGAAGFGSRPSRLPGHSLEHRADAQFERTCVDAARKIPRQRVELAAQHGVVLNPVLRTRSPRTAAQLAAAGMGVTIVAVSALAPRPAGVVRRLRPMVKREVVAVVAAPSDTLVRMFIADVHRRGLPSWSGPT